MLTTPERDEFPALFSSFDIKARRSVIAAVSGGSDSTALLSLLRTHLARHAPSTRLIAVTVDHALRAESAGEAAAVARFCDTLAIRHVTMTWNGAKPASGLSAAARQARHERLAQVANEEGTDIVFLGHTADDQAETVLMRMERSDAAPHAWELNDRAPIKKDPNKRGLNNRGLAGIAPCTLFDGRVWFCRPLLTARREALRSYLRSIGLGWVDDPSNADARYERARTRKLLADGSGPYDFDRAIALAEQAAERRERLGALTAKALEAFLDVPADGLLRLHPDFMRSVPQETAVYSLRILLAIAGGTAHLPDEARVTSLHAQLATGATTGARLRTCLSRAIVDQRRQGLFLLRELRDLPEVPDAAGIWDGRWRIADAEGDVSAWRQGGREREVAGDVPESLVRLAACSLMPVHMLVGNGSAVPVAAPWARYLPSFDIAPARAVAALIGADKIPDLPLREQY